MFKWYTKEPEKNKQKNLFPLSWISFQLTNSSFEYWFLLGNNTTEGNSTYQLTSKAR